MTYPYSVPLILNDVNFVLYGGKVGSSVAAQRQAAYFIAEKAASQDMDTLLVPTKCTGMYYPAPSDQYLLTEYAYVTKVHQIRMFDYMDNVIDTIIGTDQGWYNVRSYEFGQVDLFYPVYSGIPYKVEYVYDCGLSTGTSSSADILLALATYADILLNEIMGYGNEAVGDVGVESYSNQQYSERRIALLRTSFGTSARANFAHKILTNYRLHRQGGRGL